MADDGHSLINDMLLISLSHLHFAHPDQPLYPAGIEVNEVTCTTTDVGKMLDRHTQTAWAGRPYHQPVSTLWKKIRAIVLGKLSVVGLVVFPTDPLLRHACGSTRFKDIVGSTLVGLWNKLSRILFSQDFIIKIIKVKHIRKGLHLLARIPASILSPVQPIGASGLR